VLEQLKTRAVTLGHYISSEQEIIDAALPLLRAELPLTVGSFPAGNATLRIPTVNRPPDYFFTLASPPTHRFSLRSIAKPSTS